MLATFLQQCDHTLGNTTRDGSLGEPIVEHICQNRYKHVWQPQVHFVGQTILSWWLVEADLLQRITDFAFSNHTLATSCFSCPKVGEVGKLAVKLLKREIRTAGKVIMKVCPKSITHLTIKSQHTPIRGLDAIDIPIRKPLHFFLMRSRVHFHSLIENSSWPRSNYISLVALATLMLKVSPS